MKLGEQIPLVENGGDAFLGDDSLLGHFFHGELAVFSFVFDSPDAAEAALADCVHQFEIVL